MKITINIDEVNSDLDYIIDFVANEIKRGNTTGCAETDGVAYDWSTTHE